MCWLTGSWLFVCSHAANWSTSWLWLQLKSFHLSPAEQEDGAGRVEGYTCAADVCKTVTRYGKEKIRNSVKGGKNRHLERGVKIRNLEKGVKIRNLEKKENTQFRKRRENSQFTKRSENSKFGRKKRENTQFYWIFNHIWIKSINDYLALTS